MIVLQALTVAVIGSFAIMMIVSSAIREHEDSTRGFARFLTGVFLFWIAVLFTALAQWGHK